MGQVVLLLVVALAVAAVVFGVAVLVTGRDPGLAPAEPDGTAVPLPGTRPLRESDVGEVRFDTALRGYRMAQVDQAMRRAAYDIGYKSELIGVLEAEVAALREGRLADADALRRAREQAAGTRSTTDGTGPESAAGADDTAAAGEEGSTPTAPAAAGANGATSTASGGDATTVGANDAPGGAGGSPDVRSGGADAVGDAGPGDDTSGRREDGTGPRPVGEHGPVVRSESA